MLHGPPSVTPAVLEQDSPIRTCNSVSGLADPDVSHIAFSDFDHVYEMGEDTFLLMSVLDQHVHSIVGNRPKICFEIGSGTGIVSAHLSNLIKYHSDLNPVFYATDVNSAAALITSKTFRRNNVVGEVVLGDLVAPLETRLRGMVDVLLFNPPYVPSDDDELNKRDLTAAWAGGANGTHVTDLLLPKVGDILSQNGVFFLVLIEKNFPDEICARMIQYGFKSESVAQKRVAGEILRIVRFSRATPTCV